MVAFVENPSSLMGDHAVLIREQDMNFMATNSDTPNGLADGLAMAELIRNGHLSAEEAVSDAIKRLEKVNPALNAVADKLYDQAMEAAKTVTPASGPFAGVPTLVKDLFIPVDGAKMMHGSLLCKDAIAPVDAEVVVRAKAAGMVVFGTTTSPEFGSSYVTESRLMGATRNPWALDRTPGGSSGGSAALVAARVVPLALGNDGGGSVRVPSSACGLFGLKPSRGRVPSGPMIGEGWAGMGTSHFITISVRDSAAGLDAIAGTELGAPYAAPGQTDSFLAATGKRPKGLRIGLVRSLAPFETHKDCLDAVEKTAKLCEDLGHHVEDATLPVEAMEFYDTIFNIIGPQTRSLLNMMSKMSGHPANEADLETRHRIILREKGDIPAAAYAASVDWMHAFGRRMAHLLQEYDLILTPTLAKPPLEIGTCGFDDSNTMADVINRFHSFSPFTALWNASGQPAMSVPLHWSPSGLPIGSHFGAGFGNEELLFSLAAQLEEAMPWAARKPKICC
jgi:amidase